MGVSLRHLALAALGAAILLPAGQAGAVSQSVTVGDFFYKPGRVEIEPGDTATWTLRGDAPHSVTTRRGAPEGFDSGVKDPGEAFTRRFTKPGRYSYHCTVHPDVMRAVVQVGPDTTPPALAKLRARRGRTSVRLSFRLSEDARVRAAIALKGKIVKKLRTKVLREGSRSLVYRPRDLRPGRYRVKLTATDVEGNVARPVRLSFTVS